MVATQKIVIINPYPYVLDGMDKLLSSLPNVEVTGKYYDVLLATKHLMSHDPTMVIAEVQDESRLSVEQLSLLAGCDPSLKVVLYSRFISDGTFKHALSLGVQGFLMANAKTWEFSQCLEAMIENREYACSGCHRSLSATTIALLNSGSTGPSPPRSRLTLPQKDGRNSESNAPLAKIHPLPGTNHRDDLAVL